MAPLMGQQQPGVSVVIAVYNEADNLAPVCDELFPALQPLAPFEVVFADDGSTDTSAAVLAELARRHAGLRWVRHARRCGQSTAERTGVAAASYAWIATMDGDGQNDPRDIPDLLRLAWATPATAPAPLVAGIRLRRRDPLSRRLATRFANGLRQAVLADGCPDTGCGLKVFRRDDFLRLPAFDGMHRFLPALFQAYGHPLICKPVAHRPRLRGRSKYTNIGRGLVGIGDLLGVLWLISRTRLPGKVTEGQPVEGPSWVHRRV
jgi:dolichol-phosphate mannosyltransferase